MSMYIGEALVGEGDEIAHIDLMIGSKDGPVGVAFANALARQSAGHTNLLAVLTPNLAVKPSTVLVTKVTIKGMKQAVQMFGPAQAAVAKAVADSVADGVISRRPMRRSGHRVWRVHCPHRRRQQEDLRLQLRSHETGDRERHGQQAFGRRSCGRQRQCRASFQGILIVRLSASRRVTWCEFPAGSEDPATARLLTRPLSRRSRRWAFPFCAGMRKL